MKKEIVRESAIGITCKQCGKINPAGSSICTSCGNHLQSLFVCEKCKVRLQETAQFCPHCGGKLIERTDVSILKSRRDFVEASLLYGWTGIPLISIGWKKIGVIISLFGFSSMLLCVIFFIYAIIVPYYLKEFYITSYSSPICVVWLLSIITGFFIQHDAYGKKLL